VYIQPFTVSLPLAEAKLISETDISNPPYIVFSSVRERVKKARFILYVQLTMGLIKIQRKH
jgi:hypothetical protein